MTENVRYSVLVKGIGGRAFSSEENHYEAAIDCCSYFYRSMYRCN